MTSTPQTGQASVELLAAVPFALLVGAIVWQLALVGYSAWLCANAARVAARADAVGLDARAAARSALPRSFERGLAVERTDDGAMRVRLRVPLVVPGRPAPVRIGAVARLAEGR
jgi:pilus assembly protein CpaE